MTDMAICGARIALILLVPYCCQCQTATDSPIDHTDPAIYEAFFKRVVELKRLSSPGTVLIRLNGNVVEPIVPKLQDVLGLTGAELETLNQVASDCLQQLQRIARPQSWIYDARLQRLESGEMSAYQSEQVRSLENRQRQILTTHIQALKASFSVEHLRELESFLNSRLRNPSEIIPSMPKAR
jgi:hypothetical protein